MQKNQGPRGDGERNPEELIGFYTVHYDKFGAALEPGTSKRAPVPSKRVFPGVKRGMPSSAPLEVEAEPLVKTTLRASPTNGKEIPIQPITQQELTKIKNNHLILRTFVGDIVYPITGIDCSNHAFVVVYIRVEELRFTPKAGTQYWLGAKVNTSLTFKAGVFYSGVLFKLPETEVYSIIFHIIK